MKLYEALDIHDQKVISLVGGGGKTTIMFALAKELVALNRWVITTTTTKILTPSAQQSPHLLLTSGNENIAAIERAATTHKHITLASSRIDKSKLKGVETSLVNELAHSEIVTHIIVEADGAAGRPLKAPNNTEPVIPSSTSLVIAVMGIDAVGQIFNESTIFRSSIASALLNDPLGQVITPQLAARLLSHPQGIIKNTPVNASIIYFINKLDINNSLASARELAQLLVSAHSPQVKRIVMGSAQFPDPVEEIFHL